MKHQAEQIMENAIKNGVKKAFQPIVHWAIISVALYFIGTLLLSQTGFGRDDTDGYKRSNMALRTDYGTGCQYLETSQGGIIERRNKAGEHVGCNK